jgi:hypothetical protein
LKSLEQTVDELQSRPDCHFRPAAGKPSIPSDLRLPPDLASFYERFSEARLFCEDGDPRQSILPPHEFVQVGTYIFGYPTTEGIERTWYAIANVQDGNFLAIDLLPDRVGRCYDCFHETYGLPGHCKVIALSFTELLNRLAEASGKPFWLHVEGYGDAYGPGKPA